MPGHKDITGKRFGRLIVLRVHERGTRSRAMKWLCQCDCGKMHIVGRDYLMKGKVKSCGCLKRELSAARCRTHGKYNSPIYTLWVSMIRRCHNQNHKKYKDYGARGIKVCDRWRKFENFFADMGTRPSGKSLDRIDNNGNYEPQNCRWATPSEQGNNRRKFVTCEFDVISGLIFLVTALLHQMSPPGQNLLE